MSINFSMWEPVAEPSDTPPAFYGIVSDWSSGCCYVAGLCPFTWHCFRKKCLRDKRPCVKVDTSTFTLMRSWRFYVYEVYVCIYAYIMCMCVCVHVCMWRPGVGITVYLSFWDMVSEWTQSSLFLLGCLTSKHQAFPGPVITAAVASCFSCRWWGSELSCLFYTANTSLSQPLLQHCTRIFVENFIPKPCLPNRENLRETEVNEEVFIKRKREAGAVFWLGLP